MVTLDRWEFEKLLDEAAKKEDVQVTMINDLWVAEYNKILKNEFVRFCAESDLDYDPNWQDNFSNYWTRDFSDQFNFTNREYTKLSPLLVKVFNEAIDDFKARGESSGEIDFRECCDILFDCYVENLYNEQKHEIDGEIMRAKELKKYYGLPFVKTNTQQLTQDQNKDLENDYDEFFYLDSKHNAEQMVEIRLGLESGVDVSLYGNPKFNHDQMKQIREGLENGLDVNDVTIYADPKFSKEQMFMIRLGLEKDLNVSIYADPKYNYKQMAEIREGLKDGLDVSAYADPKYDWEQMAAIYQGLKDGLDVSVYTDMKYDGDQMHELYLGLKEGLDVSAYADEKNDWEQMEKLRLGLKKDLANKQAHPAMQLNKPTGKGLER